MSEVCSTLRSDHCTPEIRHPKSPGLFRRRLSAGLVFAPRRTAPPSRRLSQPGRRPPATASTPSRQSFQTYNCFFDLYPFLTQLRQDLGHVHGGPPFKRPCCSGNGTERDLFRIFNAF